MFIWMVHHGFVYIQQLTFRLYPTLALTKTSTEFAVDYQWNITIQVIVLIILKLKLKLLHTVFSRPCITCAICYTCTLIYLRTEKKSHCLYQLFNLILIIWEWKKPTFTLMDC